MNPSLSTYINMLRVIGAFEVFVGHMCIWNTDCGFVARLPWLGSDGVIMFFVLSGYVIAYTAAEKDRTVGSYFINRCARIYSVALPALLLTLVLEWIGIRWFPNSYDSIVDHYQFAKISLYIPLWLSFSSEFWGLNEPILSNGPFWSLCFEVWFYVLFGLFLFTRGYWRPIAITAVALLVGPKICIFFPLWGLGVLAYHIQRRIALTPGRARALLLISIGAYFLFKVYDIDRMATESTNTALADWPQTHLQMAWSFPGYFLIAVCVAGSILGMRYAALPQIARIAGPVGTLASFTFTIYLTHTPLLKFFVAIGGAAVDSMLWPAAATAVFVILFGLCTEHRIKPWRSAFTLIVRFGDTVARLAVRNGQRRAGEIVVPAKFAAAHGEDKGVAGS